MYIYNLILQVHTGTNDSGTLETSLNIFSTYRRQHDVVRSNHVTNPRDHNILLLSTICLFVYNHTKEIE